MAGPLALTTIAFSFFPGLLTALGKPKAFGPKNNALLCDAMRLPIIKPPAFTTILKIE